MSTLGELLTEAQDKFKRPDKETMINNKVISGVRAVHTIQRFVKDRVEFEILTPSITYKSPTIPNIGTLIVPADCRDIETVVAYDAAGAMLVPQLEYLNPRELMKRTSVSDTVNTCYEANGQLSFYSQYAVATIVITGFTHRPEREILYTTGNVKRAFSSDEIQNYSTWMTDTYEEAIMDWVSGYVLASLGEAKQSKFHLDAFKDIHYPMLLNLR